MVQMSTYTQFPSLVPNKTTLFLYLYKAMNISWQFQYFKLHFLHCQTHRNATEILSLAILQIFGVENLTNHYTVQWDISFFVCCFVLLKRLYLYQECENWLVCPNPHITVLPSSLQLSSSVGTTIPLVIKCLHLCDIICFIFYSFQEVT